MSVAWQSETRLYKLTDLGTGAVIRQGWTTPEWVAYANSCFKNPNLKWIMAEAPDDE